MASGTRAPDFMWDSASRPGEGGGVSGLDWGKEGGEVGLLGWIGGREGGRGAKGTKRVMGSETDLGVCGS